MKPGDRVIWLYSRKRSYVTGWRLQRIPGVIIGVCKERIRLKIQMPDTEKALNVRPENVISKDEFDRPEPFVR